MIKRPIPKFALFPFELQPSPIDIEKKAVTQKTQMEQINDEFIEAVRKRLAKLKVSEADTINLV